MGNPQRSDPAEEARLVEAAIRGETAAFQSLVERYFGLVYTIAYSRLKNREIAEDMTQEVFLRIYLNIGTLSNARAFGGWVVRMTRNLALDWIARQRTSSRLVSMVPIDEVPPDRENAVEPDVREVIDQQRLEASTREAILKLPEEQREVVLLYYSEGMPLHEIGSRLGVHRTTVRRYIDDALSSIQLIIDPPSGSNLKPLKPRAQALKRTAAIIGAASVLSAGSKAALAKSATEGLSIAASSLAPPVAPGLSLSTFVHGGLALMKAKTVTVAAIAALSLTGGGAYYYTQSATMGNAASASSNAATTGSGMTSIGELSLLDGSWYSVAKGKKEERIIFTFSPKPDGTYNCYATSSEFGIEAVPANEVTWDGKTLRFKHDQFANEFVSTSISHDEIRGRLKGRAHTTPGKLFPLKRDKEFEMEVAMRRTSEVPVVTTGTATVALSDAALASYAGTYAANPKLRINLTRDGNGLLATWGDGSTQRLHPVAEGEFGIENDITRVHFQKGSGGQIDRLIVKKTMGGKVFEKPLRKVI